MPINFELHLLMIAGVASVIVITLALGKWSVRAGRLKRVDLVLCLTMATLYASYTAYYFHPRVFRWDTSLPLHICDILGIMAILALLTQWRIPRAFIYFMGLVLAGQAIITPVGDQDPKAIRFWLYWGLHSGILALWFYDLIIRRYRPSLADLKLIFWFDAVYLIAVMPLNLAFGWNYGYLGKSKPDAPTLVDALGPWPERILLMFLIVVLVQIIMVAPLTLTKRRTT